ncbi:hypothetical protein ACIFOT_07500 [Neobacillus sp. NRS-1170]|uniref:hypothetical protein n=1 Tax=Neobacillus sp. NRS-1170 TaxID=3233898 RepID=UPI003D27F653
MMQIKHLKSLFTFKKIAIYGSGLGIILILLGQFGSGFNSFFFTALGFGILLGAVVNYLFGTFISLMEEYTIKSKEEPQFAVSTRNFYN